MFDALSHGSIIVQKKGEGRVRGFLGSGEGFRGSDKTVFLKISIPASPLNPFNP
jgi:hypothetical protein